MIPYGRQDITEADIDAVIEVLKSDFLTQGPFVPAFESAVMDVTDAKFAVAVNSATSALHIACLALGLGPGDWLWTVPNTFVASANCGLYCGAKVDFVDIDPGTYNMDVNDLERRLAAAEREGRVPKVVVPVHFSGQPTDQQAIYQLSQRYGFKVIEDASHAIGASRAGEQVGSCRWSDITVFSFHPVKIVTSGEGGMATTNDPALAEKMNLLRSHGITRDPAIIGKGQPSYCYEQVTLGFNYRMTDIHAALGIAQLQRLGEYVSKRNDLAAIYDRELCDFALTLPEISSTNYSSFHLYVIQLRADDSALEYTRGQFFNRMRSAGIGVNLHYLPVHLQPYYRALGFRENDFPVSERYAKAAVSIPLFPLLSSSDQQEVIDKIRLALAELELGG